MRLVLVLALLSFARPSLADVAPEPSPTAASAAQRPSGYHLPPAERARALAKARAEYGLYFAGALYGLAVAALLVVARVGTRLRTLAERASRRRFLQTLLYVPALIVLLAVLTLPVDIYGQWLQLKYGQSIQSWGSWFWDVLKVDLLVIGLGTPLAWGLYALIRRSPRRWWLYSWLAAIPLVLFLQLIAPLVIEPLFFKLAPLTDKHAYLADDLEKVVNRGGFDIPTTRMFELTVSEKSRSLNAYVDGLGATKRVVVWDTTIARLSPAEIMFVFGHELGHYVLGHIQQGIAFVLAMLLASLYLGYRSVNWAIARFGAKLEIRDAADLSSLPLLILVFGIFSFAATPISSAFSRHQEHAADVYGLRAIRGLVRDYQAAAAHAFQVMGEIDLDDPEPGAFIRFWLYDHPPIGERIDFALAYDPLEEIPPR
ncbi:MAG TPA: M48 family metallopeptidase [Polyangia bacterium]|nr:M48 family metallopeptidase [Polyangia bacterium]